MRDIIIKRELVQKEACIRNEKNASENLRKMPISNTIMLITCLTNGYKCCLPLDFKYLKKLRAFNFKIGNIAHIMFKVT